MKISIYFGFLIIFILNLVRNEVFVYAEKTSRKISKILPVIEMPKFTLFYPGK